MPTPSPEVVSIGYLCRDRMEFPDHAEESLGGAAYFSALGALESQARATLVSRVGTDFPLHQLPTALREHVTIDPQLPSSQVTLRYPNSQDLSERLVEMRSGTSERFGPEDVPHAVLSAAFFHLATMNPVQQLGFLQFVRARAPHAPVSLDSDSLFVNFPQWQELLTTLYTSVDIVFMNRHEFSRFGFLAPAIHLLVWKQDKDGAQILRNGEVVASVGTKAVEVSNPTGAGDYFAGSFLAALARGTSPQESAAQAVQQATRFVSRPRPARR